MENIVNGTHYDMTNKPGNDLPPPEQAGASSAQRSAGDVDSPGITLTPAGFARLMGVSRQCVSTWVRGGKISLDADGRLDPQKAVEELLRNSVPGKLRARALAPLLRDVKALQQQLAELKARLAQAEEERDFHESAAEELLKISELTMKQIALEWATLRTVSAEEIGVRLEKIYWHAIEHAAPTAEQLTSDVDSILDLVPSEVASLQAEIDALLREEIEPSLTACAIEKGEPEA